MPVVCEYWKLIHSCLISQHLRSGTPRYREASHLEFRSPAKRIEDFVQRSLRRWSKASNQVFRSDISPITRDCLLEQLLINNLTRLRFLFLYEARWIKALNHRCCCALADSSALREYSNGPGKGLRVTYQLQQQLDLNAVPSD